MPGILSDSAIKKAVKNGDIRITPWNKEQLNPASYDLTLGDRVGWYFACAYSDAPVRYGDSLRVSERSELDCSLRTPCSYATFDRWLLKPNIGYLMHTRERIWTNKYVPIVDGKSSIGRLFIFVHATAGYGDPGFDGQYTLEVTVTHPVWVYAGMRIGQIRFHTIEGKVSKLYKGNYRRSLAEGPVPSRAFMQFEKGKKK